MNNSKSKYMFILFICLVLIIAGCSTEETGVFDWLKWYFSQKSGLPAIADSISTGVNNDVTIYYDDYGVPHIVAENEKDLFFAQGYVQARDRLFQMDMMRRAASGRLAEIVGEGLVESDRFNRTLGLHRAAQLNYAHLPEKSREPMQAFADGINAYIEDNINNLPPEFILLDYVPYPWEPVDSIVIGRLLALGLGGNMNTELFFLALADEIGTDDERFQELLPDYLEFGPSVMETDHIIKDQDQGSDQDEDQKQDQDTLSGIIELMEFAQKSWFGKFSGLLGSNNWAVSGEHTVTGGAFAANDMHVTMDLPSLWYMNHLMIPGELNVTGVIYPGAPCVLTGFNEHISWTMTNVHADTMDLYIIEFHPEEPYLYRYNDEWEEAEVVRETIKVRAAEDVELETVVTRHGPVISGLVDVDIDLSLRWTAIDPEVQIIADEMEAILRVNKARDFEEFRSAFQDFPAIPVNVVYADVEGNIGFLGNGLFPVRSPSHEEAGNGVLPVPGTSDEYTWQGFVPWDEIPSLYNPESGIIVTANNKIVDDDYPHFISSEWVHPARAITITDSLKGQKNLTLQDMKDIQSSYYNSQAVHLVPAMTQAIRKTGGELSQLEESALVVLEQWGRNPVDDAHLTGPSIFHPLYSMFLQKSFLEEMPEKLGDKVYGYLAVLNVIDRIILAGESAWFDDFEGLMLQSFRSVISLLEETQGDDINTWEWGNIHTITFNHLVGDEVHPKKYNRGPFSIGGSLNSPAAMGFFPGIELPYEVFLGAPYRFVVDMSTHEAYDVMSMGNSGHFRSEHYDNLLEMWLNMEYKPMLFFPEDIKSIENTLILTKN